jgi:hypothetical protein
MKLGRTYNDEDYEEALIVIGLPHEERQREIEHKNKLNEGRRKTDTDMGKHCSKSESLNLTED